MSSPRCGPSRGGIPRACDRDIKAGGGGTRSACSGSRRAAERGCLAQGGHGTRRPAAARGMDELAGARRATVIPDACCGACRSSAPRRRAVSRDSAAVAYAGSVTSLVRAPVVPWRCDPRAARRRVAGVAGSSPRQIAATAPAWTLRPPDSEMPSSSAAARFTDPAATVLAGPPRPRPRFAAVPWRFVRISRRRSG